MSLTRFSGLLPELRPFANELMRLVPGLTISSVYRSRSEQIRLWNNRHRNPYPVAPPGKSYHEYRRAFDLNGPADKLRRAGQIWLSWGGTWSPRDDIHFQV